MGSHTEYSQNRNFEEAYDGPTVSAAAGHFLLDERFPDVEPQPILAWKIGSQTVLAVTAEGCKVGEFFVLYPDGAVRPHFQGYGSAVPSFKSLLEWRSFMNHQLQKTGASERKTTGDLADIKRSVRQLRVEAKERLEEADALEAAGRRMYNDFEWDIVDAVRDPPVLNEAGHAALLEAGF